MGCVVYFVLSDGKHPFGCDNTFHNIENKEYTLADVEKWPEAKGLIESMIKHDASLRYTIYVLYIIIKFFHAVTNLSLPFTRVLVIFMICILSVYKVSTNTEHGTKILC